MNKFTSNTLWAIGAILIVAVTAWVYIGTSNQQNVNQNSDSSMDSGIALFQERKYTEALLMLEGVPSDSPQKWRALYYRGSTYIMLKDYQAAVVNLEQALALNPTETQVMNALGVAYFKLGNLKLSKAYFASILELEPNNMEAKGLMDIMADLERQQPGNKEPES